MRSEEKLSVFINCPFDRAYRKLFHAIVFTVHDCGYIARSALEITDTSQVRVNKILEIIAQCRIGIHDISRTELNPKTKLPRFNMPLELGMFLGAKAYGSARQRRKICRARSLTLSLSKILFRHRRNRISARRRNVKRATARCRRFPEQCGRRAGADSGRNENPSALSSFLEKPACLLSRARSDER